MTKNSASVVMSRVDALGRISDEKARLTRTFCSPAMRRANDLVASWMRTAGMEVREDAVGNLIGRYEAERLNAKGQGLKGRSDLERKTLLLGSHLDTVRDAGKFDGPLGVLVAIACVEQLHRENVRLPFAIEVVGFADEEGLRYQSTYLGSKVMAGTFDPAVLKQADERGVRMADAIRKFGGNPNALAGAELDGKNLLGYVEVHIEQGPVLEEKHLSVGIVTAITGQTRLEFNFEGRAGHAGTVPMAMRRDALCAASEFVVAVEAGAINAPGLVATVGQITIEPGASNVIPGKAKLSLDIRHTDDDVRKRACAGLIKRAQAIGKKRSVQVKFQVRHEAESVGCDPAFSRLLAKSVSRHQDKAISLPSGAGHDAAALAAITPVAMLFVRCKGGISHHPDESVSEKDVVVAIGVLNDFLREVGW